MEYIAIIWQIVALAAIVYGLKEIAVNFSLVIDQIKRNLR